MEIISKFAIDNYGLLTYIYAAEVFSALDLAFLE